MNQELLNIINLNLGTEYDMKNYIDSTEVLMEVLRLNRDSFISELSNFTRSAWTEECYDLLISNIKEMPETRIRGIRI